MKKLQQQEVDNITINIDSELKVLAKAFVKNAMKKGYNTTRIYEITREICRECREEIFPIPIISLELESPDEENFRNKAERILEENEYFGIKHFHKYVYEKGDACVVTNAILELMCAMYKVFKSDIEKPTTKEVLNVALKRLDAIDINYPNRTEIDSGYRYIKLAFSHISGEHYWKSGLREFMSQYWYRRNSVSECILIAMWLVDNQ